MAQKQQTFVGLVALRALFAGMSVFLLAFGAVVVLSAESDGSTSDVAGMATLTVVFLVTAFAGLALSLERLVVDDDGVHRRNPIWPDRTTPWSQIVSVRVETDQYNTHPVIQTLEGRSIRLRAAGSLLDSDTAASHSAAEAIESHLRGAD